MLKEKNQLKDDISQISTITVDNGSHEQEITQLKKEISSLRDKLSNYVTLESNLRDTKVHDQIGRWYPSMLHMSLFLAGIFQENLLSVSGELERTKVELEKKFKDTAQFHTMKKLLDTKNKQISELRDKLKWSVNSTKYCSCKLNIIVVKIRTSLRMYTCGVPKVALVQYKKP